MVPSTLFISHKFALLTVTSPRTERVLIIRLMNDKGNEIWRGEIKANELKKRLVSSMQKPGIKFIESILPISILSFTWLLLNLIINFT